MDARWMNDTPTDPTDCYSDEPPDDRRALRRDLDLRLELVSHYSDEPVEHHATDLSPYGMWIDTELPLHPGSEVVLSMEPPGLDGRELTVFAKVARVVTGRRRSDRGPLGMGLQFEDLTHEEQAELTEALMGIPPKLRRNRRPN